MGKRILLFLLTNVLIIITISIVMSFFGLHGYLTASGLNYPALVIICLLWGMGGAFISLLLSKKIAKWMMKVKVIDPKITTVGFKAELLQTVYRLSQKAGLSKMPQVGIYESNEVNAFATGPSRSNSLIAVSTGLLNHLDSKELEGVLGHEIAHIANGDMVTMTLIQGVVNAFTMFLARVIAYFINMNSSDSEGGSFSFFSYYITVFILDILFSILGSIVVAYFSRLREFRADIGGAKISSKENMIAALQKLKQTFKTVDKRNKELATLKISNKRGALSLFSTHPSLNSRIKRLEKASF